MKKSLIATLPVAAFVAGMAVVPSVFAADNNITDWDGLKTCLENAGDQEATCKLNADGINVESGVNVGDNVTLDLGGKTLTVSPNAYLYVYSGQNFTIKNGTVSKPVAGNEPTIYVRGRTQEKPTKFTLDSTANITGAAAVMVPYNENNPELNNNYSTITINGNIDVNVKGGAGTSTAIAVDGQIKTGGPTITVNGKLSGASAAIYQAGASTITLNNTSATGASGIVTKAGTLILNNTQVTATGEHFEGDLANEQGGFAPTGAALQVVSQTAKNDGNTTIYAGNIDIQINNSTLASQNGNAIQAFGQSGESGIKSIAMSGDTHLNSASGLPAFSNGVEGFEGVTENGAVVNLDNSVWPVPETPVTPEETPENPDTADPVALYATIAAVALLGLGATAFIAKKSRR